MFNIKQYIVINHNILLYQELIRLGRQINWSE